MKFKKLALSSAVVFALALPASATFASGFQLFEQDESSLGNAHAGDAATAETAGTEYTNPAGMVRATKDGAQVSAGGAQIVPDVQFNGTVGGAPISNAQGSTNNFVPNFHFIAPVNDRLAAGFGITAPFGLATDWGDQDNVSYVATKTLIKTVNIGPSLAYAVTDKFSLGAGFDAQYLQGEFDSLSLNPAIAGLQSINKATGWGYGYNVGALYQFTDSTRVGATYRSGIHYGPLRGTSTGTEADSPSNMVNSSVLTANTTLPATSSLGLSHDLNSAWTVLASLNYTQWDSIQTLTLNNVTVPGGGGTTTSVPLPVKFRNTWNPALGANYHVTEKGMLRFGVAYDESPVPNAAARNLRLPDSDRINAAVGWHYEPLPNLGLDVGYEHIFAVASNVNSLAPSNNTSPGTPVVGNVNASGDVIGAQVSYRFA